MARVLFVRHGQASAGAADYDELSALGREQSRLLGRWLALRGKQPTHVLIGPRKRHLDTFTELAAGYHEALGIVVDGVLAEDRTSAVPRRLPVPTRADALDEHHLLQLLTLLAPELAKREDGLGRAARRAFAGGGKGAFVDLLVQLLPAWARGEVGHSEVEPWADFTSRARTIAPHIAALGAGAQVWAITSGGLISTVIGDALGCSLERTLDLMFATRNTATSELAVRRTEAGGSELSLFSFNTLPHLEEDHITFV